MESEVNGVFFFYPVSLLQIYFSKTRRMDQGIKQLKNGMVTCFDISECRGSKSNRTALEDFYNALPTSLRIHTVKRRETQMVFIYGIIVTGKALAVSQTAFYKVPANMQF